MKTKILAGLLGLALAVVVGCASLESRLLQTAIKVGVVELVLQADDPTEAARRVRTFAGAVYAVLDHPEVSLTVRELETFVRSQINWAAMHPARAIVVEDLVGAFFEDFMAGLGDGVGYDFALSAEHVARAATAVDNIVQAVHATGY